MALCERKSLINKKLLEVDRQTFELYQFQSSISHTGFTCGLNPLVFSLIYSIFDATSFTEENEVSPL